MTLEQWANDEKPDDDKVWVGKNISLAEIKRTIQRVYEDYPCLRCGDSGNCSSYIGPTHEIH